jgi:hypothetical protein
MDEVGFYYHPEILAARIRGEWRTLIFRCLYSLFIIAVACGVWLALHDQAKEAVLWIIAFSIFSMVVYGAISLVRIVREHSDAQHIQGRLALGLNRDGMAMGGVWYYWGQVGSLSYRPGWAGAGDRLLLVTRDGFETWTPIEYAKTTPAALDQAVRIFSSNLARVDLSHLDI